jgi:hypothetical protein
MCIGVCGGLLVRRRVLLEAGRRVRRGHRREFFNPSGHLLRAHPSVRQRSCLWWMCARIVRSAGRSKSRVQDVSAVAVIVVAAVGVQRIFASHMPMPQCPSFIPTA